MKQGWAQMRARYDALPRRERWMLPGAICLGILVLGQLLLVQPARQQLRALQAQHAQESADLATIGAQLTALNARLQNPDAELRAQLAALRQQAGQADQQFAQLQGALVPPQEMSEWLGKVLRQQRGLQLVALRTLAATSVTELAAAQAAQGSASAPTTAPLDKPQDAWLYRHGVQITVRGSYHDLLAYLKSLERMPRRVYWGELTLDAKDSPAVVMTLTVYTLSLEKTWWVI